MIDRKLFWTIFKECAKQSGTSVSLSLDMSDTKADIQTGYFSIFSDLTITLNDTENCFVIELYNSDPLPFQDRVWQFLAADKAAIEEHFTHKLEWKCEMIEHRLLNSLRTPFPIFECSETGYKNAITDALPDIIIYLKVFKKYIKNISDLLLNANLSTSRRSLFSNIKSKNRTNNTNCPPNSLITDKFCKTEPHYDIKELIIINGKLFNWNIQIPNEISKTDNLFIPNVDHNGYGIWIISRSNWTISPIDDRAVKLYGKGELIEEPVFTLTNDSEDLYVPRITFAKIILQDGKSAYKFIGIFKKITSEQFITDGNTVQINTYIIISNIYST